MSLELLFPKETERATKDLRNRLHAYLEWAKTQEASLSNPRLKDYGEYLLEARQFAPNSVRAHVSTLRGRLQTMLHSGELRQLLIEAGHSPDESARITEQAGLALQSRDLPQATQQLRRNKHLNATHIQQLLDRLDVSTLTGLRDAALIALMVCTGIREQEVRALDVGDLVQVVNGERMLHVPDGVGCTERHIPYEEREWVLSLVYTWVQAASIEAGPVFRGFYKGGNRVRKTRLAVQSIEDLLAGYPIIINDEPVTLRPLDLRHAFTRYLHHRGASVGTLSAYLGVKSANTIQGYLGWAGSRGSAHDTFQFNLGRLDHWFSDT